MRKGHRKAWITLPNDTLDTVHNLLDYLRRMTGERLTTSDFICMALKYYLKYIMDAPTNEAAAARVSEFVEKGRSTWGGKRNGPETKNKAETKGHQLPPNESKLKNNNLIEKTTRF